MATVPTTVYIATNRVFTGDGTSSADYGAAIVDATDPDLVTYARAFVGGTDPVAGTIGHVTQIDDVTRGGFGEASAADLAQSGRNVLVFIHGFDNTFDDALTRAAFNREWIAASGKKNADTTVVAFGWPSLGQLIAFPLPAEDYDRDQRMAGQSALHVATFFNKLEPLLDATRARGGRCYLLCHSMGNYVLQAAVERWFQSSPDRHQVFDETILAAADERFDTFNFPLPGRLSGLSTLTGRTSVYYSGADDVLELSAAINGFERLGRNGPFGGIDTTRFPPSKFRFSDCSAIKDYPGGFLNSHQYYRLSPKVRADIITVF